MHSGVAEKLEGKLWNNLVTYLKRKIGDFEFYWIRDWQENGMLHKHVIISNDKLYDICKGVYGEEDSRREMGVADILGRCGYRFTLAADDAARACAYRLRAQAVIDQGWASAETLPGGLEHDAYDAHAIHVLGWDDDMAIATGRA